METRLKADRAGDWDLQLCLMNEEFLVDGRHQRPSITSLSFVHTARRYLRRVIKWVDRRNACVRTSVVPKVRKLFAVEEVKVVTRYL